MIRNILLSCLFCFVLTSSPFSSVAVARHCQLPADRAVSEPVKTTTTKAKSTTKPVSGKATASKSTATAKVADKPGKRFWGRIMGVFRDVHSAEKKTNN